MPAVMAVPRAAVLAMAALTAVVVNMMAVDILTDTTIVSLVPVLAMIPGPALAVATATATAMRT